MPGKEDLQRIVSSLELLYGGVREAGRSLEETIDATVSAMELHHRFNKAYSSASFDVHVLTRDSDGKLEERPFNWIALDSADR